MKNSQKNIAWFQKPWSKVCLCINVYLSNIDCDLYLSTQGISQFQDKAATRKGHLDDSLQAQQYLADVAEAESWLKEKEPIVTSGDYGKDEDSAQVRGSMEPLIPLWIGWKFLGFL